MEEQPEWVKRAYEGMDYISANLDREVTLAEVATACHFSKFHFHRVFRIVTGSTVAQFARRSRLQAAARKLVVSGASVTEVAHEFGFSSAPNFHRALKKQYGVAPTELRKVSIDKIVYPAPPRRLHSREEVLTDNPKRCHLPPRKVAYARVFGIYRPIPLLLKDCLAAYHRLTSWAKSVGVPIRPIISATWDMPGLTPEEQCRGDCCLELPEDCPEVADGLTVGELPGGDYLTFSCQCVSFDFDSCYMAVLDWMGENGLQLDDGPGYEFYQASLPQVLTGRFPFSVSIPICEAGR